MFCVLGSNAYMVLVWKAEGKSSFKIISLDRRIILKWILKKLVERTWNGLISL
jgi:uncharacterized protein (UPF0128 family)